MLLIALGLAARVSTFLGGFLTLRSASHIHLVLGFSAAAVIGVALLDLLPEAIELGHEKPGADVLAIVMAAGFLAYLIADKTFLVASGQHAAHRISGLEA